LRNTRALAKNDRIEKVKYDEETGRIYINDDKYFEGVEPEVWHYHIGGYQVLYKYLKRQEGENSRGCTALLQDRYRITKNYRASERNRSALSLNRREYIGIIFVNCHGPFHVRNLILLVTKLDFVIHVLKDRYISTIAGSFPSATYERDKEELC